jgi:hypothetical protein
MGKFSVVDETTGRKVPAIDDNKPNGSVNNNSNHNASSFVVVPLK